MSGSIRVCERCGSPFAGMGYAAGVSTVLCDECAVELLPLTFEGARWLIQQVAESFVTIPPQGFRWESIRDGFASELVGEAEDSARVRELAVSSLNEFLRVEQVERGEGVHLCPFCGSDDITGEAWEQDGSTVSQVVDCLDCGETWVDSYQFVGFERVERLGGAS